jgi:hypothetical protein
VAVAGLGAVALPSRAVVEEMPMPAKPTGIPAIWLGAVTHDAAVVKIKLPSQAEARLLVRTADAGPLGFHPEPLTGSAGTVRTFRLRGLAALTR